MRGALARIDFRWVARVVAVGWALELLLGWGVALRWKTVNDFHAPAGDGHDYHKLAHELKTGGRFALAPAPEPLYWTRSPGYPMILAALVERGEAADFDDVIERGTHWNVLFDAITLLLVFLIAWEVGLGAVTSLLACAAAVLSPLLILNCCYLLRETASTTLTVATFYFLVRAIRRRSPWALVAAGALTGATMLVRSDAVIMVFGFLPAWLAAVKGWRRRIVWAAVTAAVALAVFAPWPIRNKKRFGEFRPLGVAWQNARGEPMPLGQRAWMRTWVDGLHEGYITIRLVRGLQVTKAHLHAASYDYGDEADRVMKVMEEYNAAGGRITPSVDAGFRRLASERIKRHPVRALVWLPVRRGIAWWWNFPPEEDQPLRSKTMGQPQGRWKFEEASHATMWLALIGGLLLFLHRRWRAYVWCFGVVMVTRTIAMSWSAPDGGYQRYLAPVYPLALVLAVGYGVALWETRERWAAWIRGGRSAS